MFKLPTEKGLGKLIFLLRNPLKMVYPAGA